MAANGLRAGYSTASEPHVQGVTLHPVNSENGPYYVMLSSGQTTSPSIIGSPIAIAKGTRL